MKTNVLIALLVVGLLLLMGCTRIPAQTSQSDQLNFEVQLGINADAETVAQLGIHNAGTEKFPGDEAFNGEMELRNGSGKLQASAQVLPLAPLAPGETEFPLEWTGKLSPGSYQLTWGAPAYGSTVVDFTVVERDGVLSIGEQRSVASTPLPPSPTMPGGKSDR
ncbi:MAG: hypothetical protein P8186_06950 [Anaerolineae bacterium]|jgi:hypothetical protein